MARWTCSRKLGWRHRHAYRAYASEEPTGHFVDQMTTVDNRVALCARFLVTSPTVKRHTLFVAAAIALLPFVAISINSCANRPVRQANTGDDILGSPEPSAAPEKTAAQTEADPASDLPPPDPAAASDAPAIKASASIELQPSGIHFGMSPGDVLKMYERVIENDYKDALSKAQPGPALNRVEAAVAESKAAFARSRVDFGDVPTGVDSTPMMGEYSYRNQETMLRVTRRGANGTRYFFFIRNRLWKLYDEIPLEAANGKDFAEISANYAKQYGIAGRLKHANFDANRFSEEVDWQDNTTHLRLVDRTLAMVKVVGLVYEDRGILTRLPGLRTNKPQDMAAVDPAVAAVMAPPSSSVPAGKPDAGAPAKQKNKR